MSETTIRQQIFTILSAVAGVGMVYDYERWSNDWGQFIALFKDPATDSILGWEISRAGVQGNNISNIEEDATHTYLLRGYMSVQDAAATEKTFNTLVETVRAAFRGNHTLNGACYDAGPASATVIDTRMFGGVLCHYAEIRLPVNEILT